MKKKIESIYPLSPMQQGMLFHSLYAPESGVYIEQMILNLKGSVNVAIFERAWQKVIDRYSVLRTLFVWENRQAPLQIVLKQVNLPWTNLDWRELSPTEQQQQLSELLQTQRRLGFQFNQAPLMRCTLIKLSEDTYKLIWNSHHILMDGWCLPIIFKEVLSFYEAELRGETCYLPTPRPYHDYIAWLNDQNYVAASEFWRQNLCGFIAPTPLRVNKKPVQNQQQDSDYQELELRLSAEVSHKLQSVAQQHHVTLSTIVQAAWGLLLSRYSGEQDVVFGVTVSGRPGSLSGVENMVGLFINTLPLRLQISPQEQIIPWLKQIQQLMSELQHYSYTPLVDIQALSEVPGGIPLFESILVFENYPVDSSLMNEDNSLELSEIEGFEQTNYPLTLVAVPGDELLVKISYDTVRFESDTIGRMLGHLQTIFSAVVENPATTVGELPLLSAAERHQLLVEWNQTAFEYPTDKCIHQLFESQVERTPDAVAVVFENQQLTYRELNQRANQLAHYLQTLGVRPEVLVGICVERSLEMVVGLLGILKAGGAYVPLDPNYPPERLSYMLADSAVEVLLTQNKWTSQLLEHQVEIICLDSDGEKIALYNQKNPTAVNQGENLAYIIYTSGSTGQAKGVMITHQALSRFTQKAIAEYEITARDRILQFASINFDVAVEEIYPCLCTGATLILRTNEMIANLETFFSACVDLQLTVLNLPTAYWHQLVADMANADVALPGFLRLVIVGGEKLLSASVRYWQQYVDKLGKSDELRPTFGDRLQLINAYGPTETTVSATLYRIPIHISTADEIPIGCPLAGVKAYILDANHQPVPIGVPGELYIGGDGLARGYLNRPELTLEKFIPNPFSDDPSARLYKTGDLTRYLIDGNIEYLGRIDNQVKIRGFRIELGEIEAVLNAHPQIQQAVVIATEDIPGDKRLVAYLVKSDEFLTNKQIRDFLKQQLPEYMLPSVFVTLDTIPLTPNGKIDKKALPIPDGVSREVEYIAPRTPSEEIIANIFATVLNQQNIGINDNFFSLGGHSLLATQLISRLRLAFNVEIPLRAVFESPTVTQLDIAIAQLRSQERGLILPPIQAIEGDREQLPLSWAQERLWFLNQLEGDSATYNMPAAVKIAGDLDINALQQALSEIVQRHEILRTSIQTVNGTPIQVIHPQVTTSINVVDLQQLLAPERETLLEQQIQLEASIPFNLENAPLIRCSLLQISAREYVLLLTMHHIVSDGWSIEVLISELSSLYPAFCVGEPSPLPELPLQYADFAVWQRQWLSGVVLETQLNYWRSQLQGSPELLQLPTDRPRPVVQTYHGRTQSFELNQDLTQKLQSLSGESGTTLFMTMLAAFTTLLYRYSGQSDILVGSPIANRNRNEIESLIGFFVNTLVLRTNFENNPSFKDLLAQVRETTLQAYEHQDVPFEQVVEALQPQRSLSHSPLFQVMFVLQNVPMTEFELPGVTLTQLDGDSTIAKFDLTLSMSETDRGLVGEWEYNTDLFDGSTIERMTAHFQNLLSAVVANPQQTVGELPLLSAAERHQLLVEWNQTAFEYPTDKCIHQLFESQVERTPDAVAVVFENQQLTYRELNQRANQLAHYLQTLGVRPEVLVGICVERSLEMIIGLLGILKAGGAYVPLDPNYPQERLSYMLEDAQVSVILTQQHLLEKLQQHQTQLVYLDTDWRLISQLNQDHPLTAIQTTNLAYVIYTSGSTGQPKGVMVAHQGLLNLVFWHQQTFKITSLDKATQLAGTGFDAAVWELWPYLTAGASIYLVKPELLTSPINLRDWLISQKITMSFVPTPVAQELLSLEWATESIALRYILTGGDKLHQYPSVSIPFQVVNNYGPTENTVVTTSGLVVAQEQNQISPTIGQPIANTQVYILDQRLQPVPVGVPGELHIGGAGLTRGYLNRPELTQEKFIPNPFKETQGSRLYKTGDLARYLPDGNIEYLGRIDNQVKIRGFRIELGEIEAVLNAHPQIQQAVVIVTEDIPGDKRLVAYLVKSDESLTNKQIRDFLKQQLPEYMLPSVFVTLDTIPLTPNGKIDKKALPIPDREITREHEYIAPSTAIEQILTNIWQELLLKEKISIHDNFFEIGGDSILSIQVVSRAKNLGIQVTPKQIFQHQTITELARVANTTMGVNAQQGIVTGVAPLTPIQQWLFAQNIPEVHHYNQSVLLQIPNDLQSELIAITCKKLLEHHDALRLRFTSVGSEYQQINQGLDEGVPFTVVDLSSVSKVSQPQALEKIAAEYQVSLNLSTGPIMQVVMFNLGSESDARLLIIIHHLAVDGVSWRILLSDLETIYQQLINQKPIELSAKTTAFIDWAEKLKNYAQTENVKQELNYWLNQPWSLITSLPVDYADKSQENTVGTAASVSVKLTVEETQTLLGSVNEAYNTQINDILLSALVQVLAQWTGNATVLINLEGHGREELFSDVDLSQTVGWFTSLFPVLLHLPKLDEPEKVIKSIKEQLRAIPNRGIGYGILRYLSEEPNIKQQLQTIPTPEISFNYLGQFDQVQLETSWKFATESIGSEQSLKQIQNHLLDINSLVVDGELQIDWTYSSHAYNSDTVEKLAQSYTQAIRSIIEHCQLEDVFGYTPSDFPNAQLNQLELDQLLTPVKTQKIEAIYPLSPMQQGMLFHSLYAPESGVYFDQMTLSLQGNINITAFASAWQKVVDRYSILRTFFVWENRQTSLQVVLKQVELPWRNLDWRELSLTEQQQKLSDLLLTERRLGFEFNQAPLMRCTLIQLSDNSYTFIWNHHHILMDGWCLPIILKDVLSFYEAELRGETCYLPTPRPYHDYIAWLNDQNYVAASEFWRQNLCGFIAPTPLRVNKKPVQNQQQDSDYQELELRLSAEVSHKLQSVAQQHHVTLSTIVQAAWGLLLSRYSGEQDVVFGVTVSGRPGSLSGVENMVGLFINTLPLRLQISPQEQIIPWLEQIQQLMSELQHYSYTPLVDIQALSEVPGGIPLFESILVFENYPVDSSLMNEDNSLELSEIEGFEQTNYPLTLVAVPGDELLVKISYDTVRFESDTIGRMLGHLQTIFSAVVENPATTVGELPLLSAAERHQLLVEWNDTAIEYPTDKCIHQLFELQVEKTPDAVAVVFENQQLTYRELNQRANQLAHYLQTLGVSSGMLVGICVQRSLEMLVGLLGILKAGGAYVPLDPNYPQERLHFILEDAQLKVLLTQEQLVASLPQHQAYVVCLDTYWTEIAHNSESNGSNTTTPDNIAYVIYTSGSTGQPKGVLVNHSNVVRLFAATNSWYNFNVEDVWTMFHSYAFDFSVWEIWGALLYGGRLVVVPYLVTRSPASFYQLLCQEKVTILNQTPSAFRQLIQAEQSQIIADDINLRLIIFGGEALELKSLQPWFELHGDRLPQLVNMYGITETTVHVTYRPLSKADLHDTASVIGRQIPDLQVYLLDEYLQPVPIGVAGEMYVGGAGVARGYLNRPELTQQRFISHPFSNNPQARLYKTGDLARYLPNGELEYLGRIDNQVKIRGFRIELGEIEAVLNAHPQIQQAVVIVTEDIPGDKRLVAYLVKSDESLTNKQIRDFLKQQLPEYMLPSAFVTLDTIPLTPNGKIDKKALPIPDGMAQETTYIAPRTTIELQLTQIWSSVINITPVGVQDNFFELGGHSLLAVSLMSQIQQHFQVNLPLATLFQSPTIEQLAHLLNSSTNSLLRSALVPIKSNGNQPPLFCIHPGGGNVLCYQHLASYLSSEQPFYGLQSVGLNPQNEPHTSIEQMATYYIQELQTIQPHGPYFLSGWSSGGLVAFEMAQQLSRQGEQIALLALLDSYSSMTAQAQEPKDDLAQLVELVVELLKEDSDLYLEQMREFSYEEQLIYVIEQAKQKNLIPDDFDLAEAHSFLKVNKLNDQAADNYQPQYYPGSIVLFQASETDASFKSTWNELVEHIETYVVPGDHQNMVKPPHVQTLAQKLQKSLEQAQTNQ
ncbi:MAG: amino acid adenylation domain-containing protein [Gloeotrichia echinulata DEX184]|nr:amino acid adenylation domain-containing protein [Gloeotrichia echinulata DEX184]